MELLSIKSNLQLIHPERKQNSLHQAYLRSKIVKDQIGISRVAEIGRFVTNGIFVCQATRPNLLQHQNMGHNTGAQGKGYKLEQAYVSSIMEAAENFCSEPRTPQMIRGSYKQLKNTHRIAHPMSFIHSSYKSFVSEDELIMWSYALHLPSNKQVLVPSELVYLFHFPESYGHRPLFPSSSAGLAAGFDDYTAVLKALSEIIEQHYRGISESSDVKVEAFKNEGEILKLIQRLPDSFNRNVETYFFAIRYKREKISLPYIMCFMGKGADLYRGWGFSTNPLKAIEAAHVEAFQSWATLVSGAREDMSPRELKKDTSRYPKDYLLNLDKIWPNKQTLSFREYNSRFNYSKLKANDEIELLKMILSHNGYKDIYLVNLSRDGVDCSVVKAIVPQLRLSLDIHLSPEELPKMDSQTLNQWRFMIYNHKKGAVQ